MSKSRCYLAGPISGLSFDGCNDWREYAEKKLKEFNVKALSPLRGKQYLTNEEYLKDHYDEHVLSTTKGITYRDMNDVRQSDVILVNVRDSQKVSIGTMLEIGAAFILNKPIVLVIEKEGNPHHHGMVDQMCGWVVGDLDHGLEVVAHILGEI